MKAGCIAAILLTVTSRVGEAQVTRSVSKPVEAVEDTGYIFGLPKLIEMADAIVILRIDKNWSSYPHASPYSGYKCIIEKTLKGDIPEHSSIELQLHDLNGYESPYPTGSTHLVFLIRKIHENEPTDYRMIMFDEAQISLPPWGYSRDFENKTIEEQIKILIRSAIDYQNKMHDAKIPLLRGILDHAEGSRPSRSGDTLNVTLNLDGRETKFIRLSGPEVPLPYDKVSETFERIHSDDNIQLDLVYQALVGPQATLRAEAATYLGKHGDQSSIPYLIDALSDQSSHVGAEYVNGGMATSRYRANESLKKLTGHDFGFVWDDPIEKRSEAVIKWRKWYSRQGKSSHTFYKNYKIDVPDDNYIIIGMRGFVSGDHLVLDLNTNELRIYLSYEKSSLVLTRNLSSLEADLILSIFESKEYENVPEENLKGGADMKEIDIVSAINMVKKHIHHTEADNRTVKYIINLYRELDDYPRH